MVMVMKFKNTIMAMVISAISMSAFAEPLAAQAFRDMAAAKALAGIAVDHANKVAADPKSTAQQKAAAQLGVDRATAAVTSTTASYAQAQTLDAKAAANAQQTPTTPAAIAQASIPPAPPAKPVTHYFAEFKGGNNDHSNNGGIHGGSGNGGDNAQASRSAGGFSTRDSHIGTGRSGSGFHY